MKMWKSLSIILFSNNSDVSGELANVAPNLIKHTTAVLQVTIILCYEVECVIQTSHGVT